MSKLMKISVIPLVVAIIATIVVFVDSLIAPLFLAGASFVWISFINWTAFFSVSFIERFKAIIGYVIGYLAANAMIIIGNNLGNIIDIKLINLSIATLIGVFVMNFLVMYLDKAKKLFMDSIPGIFIGIAITFSGAGEHFGANDINLLFIIIIYGMLGLLCGLGTNFFAKKISSKLK